MSKEKIETNSFCVGGIHYSGNLSTDWDVTKTGRKTLVGSCNKCNKKSFAVSHDTVKAEGLVHLLGNLGKISAKSADKVIKKMKHPGGAIKIWAKIGGAAASQSLKAALSTIADVINIYHSGNSLYLINFADELPTIFSMIFRCAILTYILPHH